VRIGIPRKSSVGLIVALGMIVLRATVAWAATPELPRVFLDTTYATPTGKTIHVPRGGDLQKALETAQPGDVITLEAGATFVGPFTLPNKPGAGWITVRTSAPDSALPPPGTRITPEYSSVMPKLITRAAAAIISTAPGAHHYRFIGV
jgi:hypothetical protein